MTQANEKENFAAGLAKHIAEEENILARYRHLGGVLKQGPAALLVRAIFFDEQHHHFVLNEMAKELNEFSGAKALPEIEEPSRSELMAMIEELLQHEQETIENCRNLKVRFLAAESELYAAILEALISDSAKHQMLLVALSRVLKA